jgi:hypothetical protein
MDKAFILAELQALIDKLYVEGYTVGLAKLTVSKGREQFDATLKDAEPSQQAQDEKAAREPYRDPDLPF